MDELSVFEGASLYLVDALASAAEDACCDLLAPRRKTSLPACSGDRTELFTKLRGLSLPEPTWNVKKIILSFSGGRGRQFDTWPGRAVTWSSMGDAPALTWFWLKPANKNDKSAFEDAPVRASLDWPWSLVLEPRTQVFSTYLEKQSISLRPASARPASYSTAIEGNFWNRDVQWQCASAPVECFQSQGVGVEREWHGFY